MGGTFVLYFTIGLIRDLRMLDIDLVTEILDVLAQNLRTLRAQRSMSQAAFAALLELNCAYYGRIERGEQNITIGTLHRLGALLGVDPLSLLAPAAEAKAH